MSETQTHVRPPEQPLLRVLVVDDNVDAAKALAMLLGFFHCDVEVAFDGESALAVAEQVEPHVGILDSACRASMALSSPAVSAGFPGESGRC